MLNTVKVKNESACAQQKCRFAEKISLMGIEVTGGNLTRRPKRSLCCLLVKVPGQINE